MQSTLKEVWSLFTPEERRRAVVMLIMVCLMALTETAGVISIMPFLSVLGRPEIVNETPWLQNLYKILNVTDTRQLLIALGILSITMVVASAAFKTLTLHLVTRFIHMLRHSLSSRLLSRYLHQPYEFFLTRNPSELSNNVLSEVDQLTFNLLQPLSLLVAHGTVVLAMLTLIVMYDPMMAFYIIVVISMLYGTIYLLVKRKLRDIGKLRHLADQGRYQSCGEALGGIKDVKITHSAKSWLNIYAQHSREQSRHSATADTLSASPLYIVEAVGYSGLILIALFLLVRSNDVAAVLPALGLYGFAAYRLLPAAQIMFRGLARLQYSNATLERIHYDLSLPEEATSSATCEVLRPSFEIRLTDVNYAYPSTPDKLVLNTVNLAIPANTSVGIFGKSGAGKSTLMDILLGLLPPKTGKLTVDGVDINSANMSNWQRAIGYVPQHIYLADTSVMENIAFGIPFEQIDMAAVERAARAAQIHEFVVTNLSEQYLTKIGDRGIRLSGGQRQRIGIARALYRDPPILFFDEATSALDSETENSINDAINNIKTSKTIITITHREKSLEYCDLVIRLSDRQENYPVINH